MSVLYYDKLDGFHNVIITCKRTYGLECIKSFRWQIECDEFVYQSAQDINWSDQVWQKAKTMFKKEAKNVI